MEQRPHEDSPYEVGCTIQLYEEVWTEPMEELTTPLEDASVTGEEVTWQEEMLHRMDRLEKNYRDHRDAIKDQKENVDLAVWSILILVCCTLIFIVLHDFLR